VIYTFLDKLRKITFKRKFIKTAVYIVLIIILSILIYLTYNEYKKTIVEEQQQEMLGVSKSISRSINVLIDNVKDSMKVISLDEEFIKNIDYIEKGKMTDIYYNKLKSYYESENNVIDAVYFLDRNGNVLSQYPEKINLQGDTKNDINAAILSKKSYIGKAYLDKAKNTFILNMYEPVFDRGDFKGIVTVAVDLETIYNILISPVKIGEKGYAMVKDEYGTIIMHPAKEQIGMNVIETRKQVYPNLDYHELEVLIKNQLTGQEGTAVYHSYWWTDNVLKKVLKLNAYSPLQLGNHFWIIAITMSYDEIQGPINKFLGEIIGIVIIIVIMLYVLISELKRTKRNKKELEKETKYLKMLNEASEQLRKEEVELYHSHKLKIIGTLAGGIAHDINNLLTPILGYSELLLMRIPENSEYHEDLEEILKASQKGKELIEQILVFSRNDNEVTKVESVDINKVMKETLRLLKAVLPRNVIIKENIRKDCGFINANYTQIHQVIFNLCTNAYHAIKNKEGIIDISLNTIQGEKINKTGKVLLQEKGYIELMVKDTGCGMDEETKARIFEPFFTTKAAGEGTGLGLFVVQSIIGKYGGVITVESELAVGSCFKVYLPLADREASSENDDSLQSVSHNDKRILIVDDNENNVKMLKKGLEYLGYEVVTETNSIRALKIFQAEYEEFDLVITDYMMPELTGSELAAEVKKIKKDTVVILMTGFMDENEKNINNCRFIDAYISKPIEMTKISELIKRC
jgi:two-component system, cell cycle sensor histidine kinase and response regulator CckA